MNKYIIILTLLIAPYVTSAAFAVDFVGGENEPEKICITDTNPNHEILVLYPEIKNSLESNLDILCELKLETIILDYHQALKSKNMYLRSFNNYPYISNLFSVIDLKKSYLKKYDDCVSDIVWSSPAKFQGKYKLFNTCASNAYGSVTSKAKLQKELEEKNAIIDKPLLKTSIAGKQCAFNLILHQNLKAPNSGYVRNGTYHWYTKAVVSEAHILQKHLNRLGFNSGKVDGIIGPLTKGAILRLQKHLNTKQDGYIGPITRNLLNHSC